MPSGRFRAPASKKLSSGENIKNKLLAPGYLLQKDLKFMSAICFIVCIISKKVRLAMLVRMASSDIGMAECKQRDQMTELKV